MILLALILTSVSSALAAPRDAPAPSLEERSRWWQNARFGMFFIKVGLVPELATPPECCRPEECAQWADDLGHPYHDSTNLV